MDRSAPARYRGTRESNEDSKPGSRSTRAEQTNPPCHAWSNRAARSLPEAEPAPRSAAPSRKPRMQVGLPAPRRESSVHWAQARVCIRSGAGSGSRTGNDATAAPTWSDATARSSNGNSTQGVRHTSASSRVLTSMQPSRCSVRAHVDGERRCDRGRHPFPRVHTPPLTASTRTLARSAARGQSPSSATAGRLCRGE